MISQNYEDSIENFLKCIEISPLNIQAYIPLGKAYFEIDEYEKAENIYKKICKID